MTQTYNLAFMDEWGAERPHEISPTTQEILARCSEVIYSADAVAIQLGGKAGRLGESVVATALLEGTLQALRHLGKAGTPVHILVDEGVATLFQETLYQQAYWYSISIQEVASGQQTLETTLERIPGTTIVGIDLHGGHDGMPELTIQSTDSPTIARRVAIFKRLFRVGVRSYAQRSRERRYADFIEDLFSLAPATLVGKEVQPRVLLNASEEAYGKRLARKLGLREEALQIACFFQSVVIAKCYCRWDEVIEGFCQEMAAYAPGRMIDFLILCGPDEMHPVGLRQEDMREDFGAFRGTNENARVFVYATKSLRELAILTNRSTLALANDTGPGHIAGALGIPTITPYLPGTLYSMHVWTSSPWHHGVTLAPNPFSYQQIKSAILLDKTNIIDSIAPELLVAQMLSSLPPLMRK
ncbi:glycosyltransferase family 9 protein [Ktedonospora formicarum]|uniref:Glycosyltransferase family 9 protein n=1 Tax=Ktedonospora formicarum TaxID=2778364 RepID=A0A8J3I366_9CHLR|nr:glycosyltransferase family 9 protein [Ktedonospora formicarum]GHO44629.1 hypothetical protein KSX_27920 [Ktedonospora formicarum]